MISSRIGTFGSDPTGVGPATDTATISKNAKAIKAACTLLERHNHVSFAGLITLPSSAIDRQTLTQACRPI